MENIYTNELRKLVEEIPNTSAYKRGIKKYTDESWIIWKKWHGFIKGFLKMKMSWRNGF